jgi:ATP:cob(I)alamin adenosyltransferase
MGGCDLSITTGTGDKGETSLWSGERVNKDSLRVEAYGTVDELSSFLGEAKHFVSEEIGRHIVSIQRFLFKLAGKLASRDMQYVEPIVENDIVAITELVHEFESVVKLDGFVIPGSTIGSSKIDICRTVARRAERRIVALSRVETIDTTLLKYINRLSDLLFIFARYEEYKAGKIVYKKDIM